MAPRSRRNWTSPRAAGVVSTRERRAGPGAPPPQAAAPASPASWKSIRGRLLLVQHQALGRLNLRSLKWPLLKTCNEPLMKEAILKCKTKLNASLARQRIKARLAAARLALPASAKTKALATPALLPPTTDNI